MPENESINRLYDRTEALSFVRDGDESAAAPLEFEAINNATYAYPGERGVVRDTVTEGMAEIDKSLEASGLSPETIAAAAVSRKITLMRHQYELAA